MQVRRGAAVAAYGVVADAAVAAGADDDSA